MQFRSPEKLLAMTCPFSGPVLDLPDLSVDGNFDEEKNWLINFNKKKAWQFQMIQKLNELAFEFLFLSSNDVSFNKKVEAVLKTKQVMIYK